MANAGSRGRRYPPIDQWSEAETQRHLFWTTLEIHGSAWFEVLFERAPELAVHTAGIVGACMGDKAVCGICGDKPAAEYVIERLHNYDDDRLVNFPLRLCDDCVQIRTETFGDQYTFMPPPPDRRH